MSKTLKLFVVSLISATVYIRCLAQNDHRPEEGGSNLNSLIALTLKIVKMTTKTSYYLT